MSKRSKIILTIIVVVVLGYFGLIFWLLKSMGRPSKNAGDGSVALIRIDGVISGGGDGQIGGSGTSPESIINQLKEAESDDDIKAILLRVNSPGGTAGASEEIYSEVKRATKPVVVSVSDVSASGAYWISSAADKIVANPASEVGSIGVIIEVPNLKGLFDKLGIDLQVIAKGKFKDIGNPARPLTGEERKILQSQLDTIYDIFINEVAKSRNIPVSKVEALANGLTYPAVDAIKFGLIDKLGNFDDALKLAGKLGKIDGEPEIVEFEKPGLFDFFSQLFGSRSGIDMLNSNINNRSIMPFIPNIK
jgi:protease-4